MARSVEGRLVAMKFTNVDGVLVRVNCETNATFSIDTDTTELSPCKGGTTSGWAESIVNSRNWTIEAEGRIVLEPGVPPVQWGGFNNFISLILQSITSEVEFGTTIGENPHTNGFLITGITNITAMEIDAPSDDVVTFSATFSGIGAPTFNWGDAATTGMTAPTNPPPGENGTT